MELMELPLAETLLTIKALLEAQMSHYGISAPASAFAGAGTAPATAAPQELARSPAAFGPSSQSIAPANRPTLPDAAVLRRIIRARKLRSRFFNSDLFADPAWDMLLDLALSHAEHRRESVTSLCLASNVPTTTALRWVSALAASGLIERHPDPNDARRKMVTLSPEGFSALAQYFEAVGAMVARKD